MDYRLILCFYFKKQFLQILPNSEKVIYMCGQIHPSPEMTVILIFNILPHFAIVIEQSHKYENNVSYCQSVT